MLNKTRFCPKGYDFSKTKTVERFNRMRDAVAANDRPMVYSLCQWGEANVATWGNGTGQSWRTTTDITRMLHRKSLDMFWSSN